MKRIGPFEARWPGRGYQRAAVCRSASRSCGIKLYRTSVRTSDAGRVSLSPVMGNGLNPSRCSVLPSRCSVAKQVPLVFRIRPPGVPYTPGCSVAVRLPLGVPLPSGPPRCSGFFRSPSVFRCATVQRPRRRVASLLRLARVPRANDFGPSDPAGRL